VGIICGLLSLYGIVIILRVVASWFPVDYNSPFAPVVRVLIQLTEPVLAPVRRVLPMAGPFDFTPIVVLIAVNIILPRLLGC
jgi:YggT family protein